MYGAVGIHLEPSSYIHSIAVKASDTSIYRLTLLHICLPGKTFPTGIPSCQRSFVFIRGRRTGFPGCMHTACTYASTVRIHSKRFDHNRAEKAILKNEGVGRTKIRGLLRVEYYKDMSPVTTGFGALRNASRSQMTGHYLTLIEDRTYLV